MNKLQEWICARLPWLSKSCWPPEEYVANEENEPEEDPAKKQYEKEAIDLRRTVQMLDARIDVITGSNRLGLYTQRRKPNDA